MNLQELDSRLRTIAEHEEEYKSGNFTLSTNILKKAMTNNEEVLQMHSDNINIHSNKKHNMNILVKKHARFHKYPVHSHDCIELNYVYSGKCTQKINGKKIELTKGQMLLVQQDTIHRIEPLSENDILIKIIIHNDYFKSHFFNRLSSNSILTDFFFKSITTGVIYKNFILFNSEKSERLRIFINEFLCEWYDPSIVFEDIMGSLLTLIFSELVNTHTIDLSNSDGSSENNIVKILDYIEKNYKNCTLKDTAEHFELNANYLSNMLKKNTGFSYKDLVQHQKINAAKDLLLNSNLSTTEIANKVCYENISFFYKKFKQYCFCLPGEYRNN